MTYRLLAATALRRNLSDALSSVAGSERCLLVTKKDKPVSAIVDIDFFEDLLAAASPAYLRSIKEARRDRKKRRLFTHAQVFGGL